MSDGKFQGSGKLVKTAGDWQRHPSGAVYRCEVRLRQAASGYDVTSPMLPGVSGWGVSEKDALADIEKKLAEAIRAHKAAGSIPWARDYPAASYGEMTKWVVVRLWPCPPNSITPAAPSAG